MRAAIASVVINSALGVATTLCESSGSCAHIIRPTEQRCCTHAPRSRTYTVGSHENKPWQSKQLVRAAKASVVLEFSNCQCRHTCESKWQLCTQHAARWAAPLHPRIAIAHRHRMATRKQAAAQQTDHASGKGLGCAFNSAIVSAATPANPVAAVHTARAPLSSAAAPAHRDRAKAP